jgi:hypothetical protein
MTTVSIAPTPSQWASASLHLERRDDWRVYRVDGERYVVLPSGRSAHVYQVRADAAGCSCPWYQRTGQRCSHMLALDLAALEIDLAAAVPSCKTAGCGELADTRDGFCDRCASDREWSQRQQRRGRELGIAE